MPILPLPQFEADLAEQERERLIASLVARGHDRGAVEGLGADDLRVLERKESPSTLVVRYGAMKMIGEFPYRGDATPGCGSKLVVRTFRGVEIGEMLTSTCPNAGCGSSVTRQQMLEYIENSGGRQYPFSTEGRVLRVATAQDLDQQAKLDQSRHGLRLDARALAESMGLEMKIVEAEPILGGERLTFYFTSEDRVDFRELARRLGETHHTRIDLRQIGARDEARLTADYERCGQYCCCKQFLKVLKPVSMRAAKVQKATLDPLKISGRCGRLMCCLRYEDETYTELRKRLPHRKSRVGTDEGPGVVVDTQILTQLVLVRLDDSNEDLAYPVEEIGAPGERKPSSGPAREARVPRRPERRPAPAAPAEPRPAARAPASPETDTTEAVPAKKKRRRRRRRRHEDGESGDGAGPAAPAEAAGDRPTPDSERAPAGEAGPGEGAPTRKKRRRRRRRRGSGETGPGSGDSGGPA
ncbi:MAG: hypothetical protein H6810_06840 [Phycisphaeraceae bacterium]|nr:MAG: hypothetical protein H6810_06840 [Phycisphaeraceae bacterium]